MLAGKNVTPCFHLPAPIVSIIHIGKEGSSIAIPVLAKVIAPWGKKIVNENNFYFID